MNGVVSSRVAMANEFGDRPGPYPMGLMGLLATVRSHVIVDTDVSDHPFGDEVLGYEFSDQFLVSLHIDIPA